MLDLNPITKFGVCSDGYYIIVGDKKCELRTANKLPHSLSFARPQVKFLRTKMGHLLDMSSAYKIFQASPALVNCGVSTTLSWVIE
jgi:hypothetical protein